ncbi:MAG: flagellar basal body P-ring formation protein FlgA [Firmicutes bacterium]|nr:flagellar basal body P-ring formation protein FlgA [Bacillota bacterium]
MRRVWFLVLSFLLLTGMMTVAATGPKAVITIPPALEVEGEELELGQLAMIEAEPALREKISRINLGRAPRFGETASLYRTNVVYILDRSGLAGTYTLEMPPKVTVTRAGQLVTADQMLAAVEAYIGKHASPAWTGWRVEPGRLQERRVPRGELAYRLEGDRTPLKPGLNTFRLGILVDGAVLFTVPVTVRLTIEAPVYVSTQPLDRYTELSAEVVRREVRELTTGNEWLGELTAGRYRVTRDLPAGRVLLAGDLEEKPLVTKGSKVRLILESGSVQVELTAQAEEDGWLNQEIIVTNLDSNRRLTATVMGPGLVEVKLK